MRSSQPLGHLWRCALLLLVGLALTMPAAAQPASATPDPQATPSKPSDQEAVRSPIGDLNAEQVRAGEFPGAFVIPGTGDVSLAIVGLIKATAMWDTNAESQGPIMLPALLGETGRDEQDGNMGLTAELSRLAFDARAPVPGGRVRGYIEFDFNGGSFNLRESYLSWKGGWGELVAGKAWSTFMDLQVAGEGLTETTVSGAIYNRQAMIRYVRPLNELVKIAVAMEDPATTDVLAPPTPGSALLTGTHWPDGIGSVSIGTRAAHVQIGGLIRNLEFDPNDSEGASDTGWGFHVSGHTMLGRDKLTGEITTGRGLARYMIGLRSGIDGAFIGIDPPQVYARRNSGGWLGIRHPWNARCRTSVAGGYATAETIDAQGPGALANTWLSLANVLCRANRFTTIGVEYDYYRRENRDGSDLDNHRVMFGMQLF